MRVPILLLLLAAAAAAQDPVRAALDEGRYADALALAEAEPSVPLRQDQRAQAICGLARDVRRGDGYAAAIDFLEPRLDHPRTVRAFADCCLWGGEEERGLRGIRAASVSAAARVEAEIGLLKRAFRYRDAAAVARAHGWKEGEEWARGEAELRERLAARARRAGWLAAAGAAGLLGVWTLLRRLPRPASARATS
jgi:hypothetical protein